MQLPKNIGELAIWIVIIAAIIALVFVAFSQFGIIVPGWFIQIFWIIVVAVVVILAIKLIMNLKI